MVLRNCFKGKEWIYLQPNDFDIPYTFKIKVSTAQDSGDGWIPYGTSVESVVVSACDADDGDATSDLIHGTPSVAENLVSVKMDYPGEGEYKLTLICTLNTGAKTELDFPRIRCGNN